jgi:hypothetical protein
MLYVQYLTPDDGRQDRPKHVEWYSMNSKIVHLLGFTIEIYQDSRSHERQIFNWHSLLRGQFNLSKSSGFVHQQFNI